MLLFYCVILSWAQVPLDHVSHSWHGWSLLLSVQTLRSRGSDQSIICYLRSWILTNFSIPFANIIYGSVKVTAPCLTVHVCKQHLIDMYTEQIPESGPPTWSGRLVRYSYKLTVGAQRLSGTVQMLRIPFTVLKLPGKFCVYWCSINDTTAVRLISATRGFPVTTQSKPIPHGW